ncbi:hypothetical protein BDF14DRAFT_1500268 [Spinellus fusiger]|nr:hypothetical protein BDF14DRAFT_1500268 [Spinellus fusiger]
MPTLTPNATATIPATVSVPEGLWHWNPQSTADRYPAFRVIECTPQTGTEGDTIHIRLTGTSLDQLIPRLRMAFGLCVVPVRLSLSNLSDFVNLTAIVPQWQMCQTPGIKALVHVIVLQYTNDQVIEHVESSLFATYFHYGHRSLPMDYVAYDENNNQRLPIPNGELSGYDMSEYAGYYDTNRSPQYSSQSSSRPQDYYEGK